MPAVVDGSTTGSSPHVRGAPVGRVHCVCPPGIIPACAGSTRRKSVSSRNCGDHPRMCGEHADYGTSKKTQKGSSPHVRGAPFDSAQRKVSFGIIPACAGSTMLKNRTRNATRDHPRMCGEHVDDRGDVHREVGSSPHVRGALPSMLPINRGHGIIPACAGSTRHRWHG